MKILRGNSWYSVRGTTLVELIVSMAITLSVMVLLATIVSSVSSQWNRGSSRILMNAEARVALDYLVQDLRSIERKGDGSEWFKMGKSSAGGSNEDFLLLFLARPLDAQGQVTTIAYRLGIHDPMGGDAERPVLYRCVFPPEESISHLGATDLEVAWNSRLEEVIDADWFLAENVIEVGFTFHLKDSSGQNVVVQSLSEVSGKKAWEYDGVPVTVGGATLESATVSLMLLDEMGLQVLRQGTMPLQEIIDRYGYEFVEEVKFSKALAETKYDI